MEWFPWFSAYYRSKTLHLTLEQDALYRRLIDHYMETRAPIPDNDQALARICAVDIECIKHASSILRAFFTPKNGMLFHDFCDNQLDIQDKKSKIRSDISQKAAKARWKKNKQNQSDEYIEHASMHASDDASMDATGQDITRQEEERTPLPPKAILPEWLSETVWADFCKHRGRKFTDNAKRLTISKLDRWRQAGHDPTEILNKSIMNGWQGIFEPKEEKNGRSTNNSGPAGNGYQRTASRSIDDIADECKRKYGSGGDQTVTVDPQGNPPSP